MAQYSIIRMQKFKSADLQGIQKHNQRQGKNSSNKDIDPDRTKMNYDLVNQENIRYEKVVKSQIAERVKRKPRDNSVVLCEFLISASPEYMQQLSPEEKKDIFKQALNISKKNMVSRTSCTLLFTWMRPTLICTSESRL